LAAWPLIAHDLRLSYGQIGLLLAIPGFVGCALDPLIGVIGDGPRRRALIVLGGAGLAISTALSAGATGFWILLAALVVGNPAVGAFVSLAQATLMDLRPDDRERSMARWTLAGSVGYVGGPLLLSAVLWAGLGWRAAVAGLAVLVVPAVAGARLLPPHRPVGETVSVRQGLVGAAHALRRRDVLRQLALLEASDLLVDVFHGFMALYLVNVARFDPGAAALGVAVWTGAGLAGDALLLAVLRRVDGVRYLRWSAALALVAYPAFLLASEPAAKLCLLALLGLLNSGWYAIPKAGLYRALDGKSGTAVAVAGVAGFAGSGVPLALGIVAGAAGLAPTMWILLLAPVALLAGTRRR
jgi:FSR family fosmidomycin resistance protein-like MFS transporter